MTRTVFGLLAAGVVGQCGCVGIKPVGPMADLFPPPKAAAKSVSGAKVEPAKDGAAPALPPAPSPPAPALLVSPGEVTDASAEEMAKKLAAELEADRKATDAMPRYAEVSVVGRK